MRKTTKVVAAISSVTAGLAVATTVATAAPVRAAQPALRYTVTRILSGLALRHSYTAAGSAASKSGTLTQPDDISVLGRDLFVAFQNGVGPQGQASADGNRASTIVEMTLRGVPLRQWDVAGKSDGLTADPASHTLIATVNEDAHSSVYVIDPRAPRGVQVQHYRYSKPLPHNGGTDAISIYHGLVLISASAPGTTGPAAPQPAYPAVYRVTFDRASHIAAVRPLFFDEATATVANLGGHARGDRVRLALTDPDSNEIVPLSARRFRGDLTVTSQGDKEQIFVRRAGRPGQRLFVLTLSNSVDDTAWVTSPFGRLFATDHDGDAVDVVTGRFHPGAVLAAVTPCDANGSPATCPAPGFPPNYLGVLNPWTGQLSRLPLRGASLQPQGMAFVG
jgi:hypothetical protein